MRKRLFITIFCACLLAFQLQGQQETRDWEIGTLTDVKSQDGGTATLPVAGATVVVPIYKWAYTVETETMIYVFVRRSPKPLNLTINGKIAFALDKSQKAYLIDGDDRQFHVSVVRKVAKNAAP
jgi:hypothetical protein